VYQRLLPVLLIFIKAPLLAVVIFCRLSLTLAEWKVNIRSYLMLYISLSSEHWCQTFYRNQKIIADKRKYVVKYKKPDTVSIFFSSFALMVKDRLPYMQQCTKQLPKKCW
jgi:hypothetical protein